MKNELMSKIKSELTQFYTMDVLLDSAVSFLEETKDWMLENADEETNEYQFLSWIRGCYV